jgi:hypothetical protein
LLGYFSAVELSNKIYAIIVLAVITFLFNLPFGYARARAKRYSFRWFLFIHVPIPVIFLIRTISHIEMRYIPFFIGAAVIGQILGGKLEL